LTGVEADGDRARIAQYSVSYVRGKVAELGEVEEGVSPLVRRRQPGGGESARIRATVSSGLRRGDATEVREACRRHHRQEPEWVTKTPRAVPE